SQLIEMNQPVDLKRLVPLERHEPIITAIEKVGDQYLKQLREYLGERYSYDDIKLVRAWWRRQDN
ncbi:MAG: hypothetical protein F6K50_33980, partial [Moorea sp. SIO3I7]|nr:hypothetical protein [Moorena sp. SIO3I7]